MSFYKDKAVLVTGSHGLIGTELVNLLREAGAKVRCADKKIGRDISRYSNCLQLTEDVDFVFNCFGIKGSARMTEQRPYDFMAPMLQCDTNIINASIENKVKRFLYVSSIALINFQTDKYPATAKATAELLIEAYKKQHPEGTQFCIARPASVYGKNDNFTNQDAMVIPSLVRKFVQDPIPEVWGLGEEERDFIYAEDCARALMLIMEKMPNEPIAVASGETHQIKEIVQILSDLTGKTPLFRPNNSYGDAKRSMDIQNLRNLKFECLMPFKKGIEETYNHARGLDSLK